VGDVRLLEPDNARTKFRQAQPVRHLPLEDAPLTLAGAFPGDDQDQPGAARTRRTQEAQQSSVSFALRQPVLIEAPIDRFLAARNALFRPAAE